MMNKDSFVDGITAIRLANGMVRIEYGALSITETDDDGSPVVEKSFRIVMTPQAFLKSFGKMERMINALVESGVVIDSKADKRSGPARNQELSLAPEDRRKNDSERRKFAVTNR